MCIEVEEHVSFDVSDTEWAFGKYPKFRDGCNSKLIKFLCRRFGHKLTHVVGQGSWQLEENLTRSTLITQKLTTPAHVFTITTKFQFIQIFDTLILIAHFT